MNQVASRGFNRLPKFQIARYGSQFYIRQPFGISGALFNVSQERFRSGYQWPLLTVGTQTKIDTIEVSLAGNAGQRRDQQLSQAGVSLVMSQFGNRRRSV